MLKNENNKIAKTLETAANIGIVVFVLAALGFLAKGHWLKSPEPKQISVGEQFALKNTNWQASGGAVVLGISTTCHFCTESAPFYRELVKKCEAQHVHTIAVLPQSQEEAEAYLSGEGVVVDEIRQYPLSQLEISGTPTLLMIDARGTVKQVWLGKLQPNQEKDVMAKLGS
jgi:H+/gluconate symporter-like permease